MVLKDRTSFFQESAEKYTSMLNCWMALYLCFSNSQNKITVRKTRNNIDSTTTNKDTLGFLLGISVGLWPGVSV